jgi:tRNA (cmo5U34)-methyltransferase
LSCTAARMIAGDMKPQNDNTTPHRSDEYDAKVRQTIPLYDSLHRETIDLVRTLRPAMSLWLDTGCGTGNLAELALPAFPRCTFLLADPSDSMLALARKKLEPCGDRVVFLGPADTGSVRTDLSPDVITAIQAHHYLDGQGRERATARCRELLKEGGLYVTFENTRPETGEGVRLGLERWKRFLVDGGRSVAEAEAHAKRFGTEYFPITVNEHVSLLKQTGFRTVELFWFSYMQAGFYAIK